MARTQAQSREQPPHPRKHSSQHGIVYGPAQWRHLGMSLGINIRPTEDNLCSFECVYCHYRSTKKRLQPPIQLKSLPPVDDVSAALERALAELAHEESVIDSITICGNGEPTGHPALADVIVAVKTLRDRYQPHARVAILSNSSTVGIPSVRAALELLDLKIMKFDAGSEEMFRQLNHPTAPVYMGEIVAGLKELNNIHIESLFVQGRATNVDHNSVEMWVDRIREIHPLAVQVYTIDREPADKQFEKVSLTTLQWIANEVRWRAGVEADVFK